MNTVILVGRLVRDPETRYANDIQITAFTMAVNRLKRDEADFPRVKSFGKTAEICQKYLAKGRQVAVRGRLQTGSYEKDGVKHYTTDVIADEVQFIGSKVDASAEVTAEAQKPIAEHIDFVATPDEIPF